MSLWLSSSSSTVLWRRGKRWSIHHVGKVEAVAAAGVDGAVVFWGYSFQPYSSNPNNFFVEKQRRYNAIPTIVLADLHFKARSLFSLSGSIGTQKMDYVLGGCAAIADSGTSGHTILTRRSAHGIAKISVSSCVIPGDREEAPKDIILDNGVDEVTKTDNTYESILCFSEVLANHFVAKPENGKHIIELIALL
ncbi:hypothetical protein KSP39_PZI019135 [Platanthera zijinensis]|uniref:Uncharacterized protein n=1 Tax=Platanthera zijinensis TaxID=2320716 RepID=A0AAP0FXR6_9ASPA